jgi:hypothetical protein
MSRKIEIEGYVECIQKAPIIDHSTMAARALIFLGLYRRCRFKLPTWQIDTVRVIAKMIAESERENTRQYVESLPNNSDLNVRNYDNTGREIYRDVCRYYEYLQVLTIGTYASRMCNAVRGPTRRGQYPFGFCIELQKLGTVVYGNEGTEGENKSGDTKSTEGTNDENFQQNPWKFVGNEIVNCGCPQRFAITAINRMYFISCRKSADTFVRVYRVHNTHYRDPQLLQLLPGDLIQVGTDHVWITYKFCQYKIAPVDLPLKRWEIEELYCSHCMHELIIDVRDVFTDARELADKSPVLIDGMWRCPKCFNALPSQEMFSLPVTEEEWC